MTWKKILCAMDYSDSSKAAFRAAVDLAGKLRSELTLLHVGKGAEAELEVYRSDAQKAGIAHVHAVIDEGDPAGRIVDRAEKGAFDLVVMGTRGRTGRAASLAGSVAETVVRRSHCPVLTLHEGTKRG